MQTRRIGNLDVSVIGLGCNNFGMRIDAAQTKLVVDAALGAGINFFDTADIYGGTNSERFLGEAIKGRRDGIILATKFGMEIDPQHRGADPAYVAKACNASLQRLGTDYIDLYWLHQPDPLTPIADTLGALNELVQAGKVRQIGCSNFSPAQLREAEAEAQRLGTVHFTALQNELSLIQREALLPQDSEHPRQGTLDACRALKMAFVPYFPLASGLLSGKYRRDAPLPEGSRIAASERAQARYLSDANWKLVERLQGWLAGSGESSAGGGSEAAPAAKDLSLLELAFAWLLAQNPVASVIAGATSPAQVQANAAAARRELSAEELAQVNRLLS
ncbi:aldo/keto reductase [bacterium]|nr:aldo/keto reductase [bacterium]